MKYVTCLLLFLLWLSACSEREQPQTSEQPKPSPQAPQQRQGAPLEPQPTTVQQNKKAVPADGQKKRQLDLSIDKLSLQTADDSRSLDAASQNNRLPNLFEKNKKEKKTNISAGVLTDETNEDYLDSINGAEVSVEVKLP